MPSRPLHLAVDLDGDGAHPASWRRARHAPDALLTAARVGRVVRVAENAGFTLATFEDSPAPPGRGPDPAGRIGAVERAAFAAPLTSVIALAPVVSTTYSEPFHVASQLASLDFAAAGRAGWVVSATDDAAVAVALGRPFVAGGEDLRREARDAVAVNRALWDSWEDDAVVRDVATGRYLDVDKLHHLDFVGETYSVKGPAIVPRPPQGQLVVVAPEGLVPPDLVDVTLVADPTVDGVATAARRVATPRVFAEVEVVLDTADGDAVDRLAGLDAATPWPRTERLRHVGSATALVGLLTDLARVVDGVRLLPLVLDEELPVLSAHVLPALFHAGVATRPVAGSALRTTLGLPRPANRFATQEVPA
ncbi:LLM class flavin-dependent oxidoreductase [Pseudonocardia sp. N23]|uniref:LLM class flavin-dependent oxidoreductase n=1 Tax=Pseudonocardia sp. N23 TaxID=1987376 RepID=UPI000BFC37B8|nr:LLM class flavin-dependent oxidoreductase [Pseudonocardia sp. N23]GAY07992.1 FMNH2-utilizing oxygenase [Pseudonocardia sp. N23]